jgi:hypothetical protein
MAIARRVGTWHHDTPQAKRMENAFLNMSARMTAFFSQKWKEGNTPNELQNVLQIFYPSP